MARFRSILSRIDGFLAAILLTPYSKRRQREYLTVMEIGLLMDTARERERNGTKTAFSSASERTRLRFFCLVRLNEAVGSISRYPSWSAQRKNIFMTTSAWAF